MHTNGSARGVAEELFRLERLAVGHAVTPQMGNTSLEDGLEFRDGDGNLLARVGGNGGAFDFEYVEGPTPPQPSPPLVISETGFAQVTWDGQFADPVTEWNDPLVEATRDVDRVEVHFSREPDFTPDSVYSFAGAMPAYPEGGKLTVGPFTEGGAWFCRLVAKSKPGHSSVPSMTVPVTVVGVDLESKLMNTWLDADGAMESADGKNSVHHGDEEPSPPPGGFKEGDLWFGPGNMPHRWDGSGWVSAADERVDAVADAVESLQGELQDVRESASNARGVVHYSPSPPAAAVEGELWFDTSAEGNNAPHVWNGSDWLSLEDARVNGLLDEVEEALGVQRSSIDAELAGLRSEVDAGIEQALTDAAATAQAKADAAQAAAEAAARAYAEAIAAGAEEADLSELRDHMDLVAEQARLAAVEAAAVQARELVAASETTVMSAVNAKNRLVWSTEAPPTEAPSSGGYSVGDTWFRHAGGRVTGQWEFTGSVWSAKTLDNAVIANLDAGKITSGFIDAARIRANSITADKVLVGGANLLPNPNFENEGEGWQKNGGVTIAAGAGIGGSNAYSIPEGTVQRGGHAGLSGALTHFRAKVEPGKTYRVSGWARGDSAGIVDRGAGIFVRCYQSGSTSPIGWGYPSTFYAPPVAAGEWSKAEALVTIPDGFNEVSVGLYAQAVQTGSLMWCLPSVTLATDGTSIVPGAISTGHLSANAVTTENISAGAVSTDHLAAEAVTAGKIKAGTITADLMAAGTITAESGVIGSIDAGKITVGELDGARIKAGTVTSDMLLVGSDRNLMPNGDLTGLNLSAWWGTPTRSVSGAPEGCFAQVTYPGSASTVSTKMPFVPCGPGEEICLEVWVKADKPDSRLFIEVRDRDGHAVRPWSGEGASGSYPVGNYTVPTTWKKLVVTGTTQATTTAIRLGRLYLNHTSGAERNASVSLAGLRLYRKMGSTLIADGAITTEKIAAGAITAESGVIGSLDAGKITVGEMDGKRIRANTVATEQLAADAIDGMTITGATVQTSRANSGVKIDASGLRLLNDFGVQIASMTHHGFEALGSFRTGGDNERRVEIRNDLWAYGAGVLFLQKDEATSPALSPRQARIGAPAKGHLEIAASEVDGGYRNRLKLLSSGNVELLSAKMNGPHSTGDYSRLAMISDQNASDSGLHLEVKGNNRRSGLSVDLSYYTPISPDWSGTPIPVPGDIRASSAGVIVLEGAKPGSLRKGNVVVRNTNQPPSYESTFSPSTNWGITFDNSDNTTWGGIGYVPSGWGNASFGIEAYGRTLSLVASGNSGHALVNHLTTSNSANIHMQSDGTIWRSTSARRTKLDERPIEDGITDFDDRVLSLVAKTWFDKAAVEAFSDRLTAEENGEEFVGVEVADPFARIPGMVAEDVLDAGLAEFVTFDADGNVEGLMYDRLGVALIPVVARLRDRIVALENALA